MRTKIMRPSNNKILYLQKPVGSVQTSPHLIPEISDRRYNPVNQIPENPR